MIKKKGDFVKIEAVASSKKDFEKIWKTIEEKNNIIKCKKCSRGISMKFKNTFILKKEKLSAIVKEAAIICPYCGQINQLK